MTEDAAGADEEVAVEPAWVKTAAKTKVPVSI